MNPTLLGQLTLVAAACAVVAGIVVVADLLPAPPRPMDPELYGSQAIHGSAVTREPDTIYIDPSQRIQWRDRAAAARTRRTEELRRQLAAHEAVVAEIRGQLQGQDDATTALPESAPGGAR